MARVVIVEDHPTVREGVKRILSGGTEFSVVGEAADGEEALDILRNTPCDVVILDITLPKKDGLEVLSQMKLEMPGKPVLVLSMHPEDEYASRMLHAGAHGYITKDAACADLLGALRKVARGGRYMSSALAEKVALGVLDYRERPAADLLSRREYQILAMISSGETVTEIANELNLSVKTVSTYRSRILEKLALRNNAELTRYAIKQQVSLTALPEVANRNVTRGSAA
jgi:two-component system, NarL family, invasion response regulator UvrY